MQLYSLNKSINEQKRDFSSTPPLTIFERSIHSLDNWAFIELHNCFDDRTRIDKVVIQPDRHATHISLKREEKLGGFSREAPYG